MQAGRERSSLPLIRRFNDHSNKLLHSGGYVSLSLKRTKLIVETRNQGYQIVYNLKRMIFIMKSIWRI
jgi:hypothetical protein